MSSTSVGATPAPTESDGSAQVTNLPAAAAEQVLAAAAGSRARRAGRTVIPGAHAPLKQTLLALCAGTSLNEHDAPTAATLQVLHGRVRLVAGPVEVELTVGDHAPIPPQRHQLDAIHDAVVLLTVVQGPRSERQ